MEIILSPVIPMNTEEESSTVATKYLSVVTAEQVSTFLKYEWKKELGSNPLIIAADSLIQLDKEAQRGYADEYKKNLLQQRSKVNDIAKTLLGSAEGNRAFLGTLVWNIRPTNGSIKLMETVEDGVKQSVIKINTDAIFLPDSAHRHFGISEAFRQYAKSPEEFENFNKNATFSLEVYNLNTDGEFELFRELNAKQKKISAAKQKAVDTVSPAGRLKGRILQIDQGEITVHYDETKTMGSSPFFNDNYEETSNQLNNHKLLTMSVFMAAIKEMFSRDDLAASKKDDDLSQELAEYFVRYFYTLRDMIQIQTDVDGACISVRPFYNLYHEKLRDIVEGDSTDEALNKAVADATSFAKQVRLNDKTNSNPVIKAFARLAKTIRFIPRWDTVLARIQTHGVEKQNGKLFQLSNSELIKRGIAKKKDDNTINIPVQNKEVTAIYQYLTELAGLDDLHPTSSMILGSEKVQTEKYVLPLNRDKPTVFEIEMTFGVGANVDVAEDELYIRIDNDRDWSKGRLTSKKKRPTCQKLVRLDVEHPVFGKGIHKYLASFKIELPSYELLEPKKFNSTLKIRYVTLDGTIDTLEVALGCQPSEK